MSDSPGRAPPMLIIASLKARPMLALARCPGPIKPKPLASPQASRAGPLTIRSGARQCVVDCISAKSNVGWQTARQAASTTGK